MLVNTDDLLNVDFDDEILQNDRKNDPKWKGTWIRTCRWYNNDIIIINTYNSTQ